MIVKSINHAGKRGDTDVYHVRLEHADPKDVAGGIHEVIVTADAAGARGFRIGADCTVQIIEQAEG